jgi:hypothetical protein
MAGVLAAHRKIIRAVLLKITVYYAILATVAAIAITAFPGIVEELPLGGVGDIANYGSSSTYDLEEAFLSADDEELEDIVTETSRVRRAGADLAARRVVPSVLDGNYAVANAAGFLGL